MGRSKLGVNRIEDFGEKIGGARKDLYKNSIGASLKELNAMTDIELQELRVRDAMWVVVDYVKLCEDYNIDPVVAFYIRAIRQSIPVKSGNDILLYVEPKLAILCYAEVVRRIKELCYGLSRDVIEFSLCYGNTHEIDSLMRFHTAMKGNIARIYSSVESEIQDIVDSVISACDCGIEQSEYLLKVVAYILKLLSSKILRVISSDRYNIALRGYIMDFPNHYSTNINTLYFIFYNDRIGITVKNNALKEALLHANLYGKYFNSLSEARSVLGEQVDTAVAVYRSGIEKSGEKEKLKLDRPQLDHIERVGPVVRKGNIDPNDYIKIFKFRGGEFGNWNTQSDRQAVLNYGFDSLIDLAVAMDVPLDFITLG